MDNNLFDDSEEEEEPTTKLVDGINIKTLLDTSEATFEINTNVDSAMECQQNFFNNEDFLNTVNLDCIDLDSDSDEESPGGCPGKKPYDRLAQKMIDLVPEGKVKKRIKREGMGNVVPPDSLIWMHYNSYLEYADEPFDSTYLRGRPTKVRLGKGQLVYGLEIGIATMKQHEIAQFLIHPDYAYGKMGVPPRIPGESEILIHVELLKVVSYASALDEDPLTNEEQEKAGFPKVYKTAESYVLKGNDMFKKHNFHNAIQNYRKAVNMLERVNLENEEQQEKQQKLLLRCYVNMGLTYNKQNASRFACTACKSALYIDPNNTKALYNFAVAQMDLGGYENAKVYAMKARKFAPQSQDINMLLTKLDSKIKMYKSDMGTFAKKALQVTENKEPTKVEGNTLKSFEEEASAYLQDFVSDANQTNIALPAGMTKKEENFFKEEVRRLGLIWRELDRNGQVMIRKK